MGEGSGRAAGVWAWVGGLSAVSLFCGLSLLACPSTLTWYLPPDASQPVTRPSRPLSSGFRSMPVSSAEQDWSRFSGLMRST